MERTHVGTRRQVLDVIEEKDVAGHDDVVITRWEFTPESVAMACKFYCHYQDYAHTRGHATV
jgi:hypothetical protein